MHTNINWEQHQKEFHDLGIRQKLRFVWWSLVHTKKVERINQMFNQGVPLTLAIELHR